MSINGKQPQTNGKKEEASGIEIDCAMCNEEQEFADKTINKYDLAEPHFVIYFTETVRHSPTLIIIMMIQFFYKKNHSIDRICWK